MSSNEQFFNIPGIILKTALIYPIVVINSFTSKMWKQNKCIMFKEAKVKLMYGSCNGAYLISYIWTFGV